MALFFPRSRFRSDISDQSNGESYSHLILELIHRKQIGFDRSHFIFLWRHLIQERGVLLFFFVWTFISTAVCGPIFGFAIGTDLSSLRIVVVTGKGEQAVFYHVHVFPTTSGVDKNSGNFPQRVISATPSGKSNEIYVTKKCYWCPCRRNARHGFPARREKSEITSAVSTHERL